MKNININIDIDIASSQAIRLSSFIARNISKSLLHFHSNITNQQSVVQSLQDCIMSNLSKSFFAYLIADIPLGSNSKLSTLRHCSRKMLDDALFFNDLSSELGIKDEIENIKTKKLDEIEEIFKNRIKLSKHSFFSNDMDEFNDFFTREDYKSEKLKVSQSIIPITLSDASVDKIYGSISDKIIKDANDICISMMKNIDEVLAEQSPSPLRKDAIFLKRDAPLELEIKDQSDVYNSKRYTR